jgi:hypothetical protein
MSKTLTLTYKQFVAVLRKWDAYVFPEFSELSRMMEVVTDGMRGSGYDSVAGHGNAVHMQLSEMAKMLWQSFEAGAGAVDAIHDEMYVQQQVEHFQKCYASVEAVEIALKYSYAPEPLMSPPEMFLRLGKPAQGIVIRDGLLPKAVEVYEQAVELTEQEKLAEQQQEEAKLRAARERRADPNYVRPLSFKTKLEVRGLDREQCVFCGVTVKQYRYVRLLPTGHTAVDVVLACPACASQLNGQSPDAAGRMRLFGRYQLVLPL